MYILTYKQQPSIQTHHLRTYTHTQHITNSNSHNNTYTYLESADGGRTGGGEGYVVTTATTVVVIVVLAVVLVVHAYTLLSYMECMLLVEVEGCRARVFSSYA